MRFIILTLTLCFIGQVIAKDKTPTQTQVLKKGFKRYFKRLPKDSWKKIISKFNMDTYHLYEGDSRIGHDKMIEKGLPLDSPFSKFFGHNTNKRFPKKENSYPFFNKEQYFQNTVQMEYGLCAGLTITLRKFNMLSYFDPKQQWEKAPSKKRKNKWIKYYKKKIDRIQEGEAQIIPGFKNLYELSSNSDLQPYIKQHIVRAWSQSNGSIVRGIKQFTSTWKEYSKKNGEELYEKLKHRLSMDYNPIVYLAQPAFSRLSRDQWIHVLQVFKISQMDENGEFEIHLWDINYPAYKATQIIKVKNGKALWEKKIELSAIQVLDFDRQTIGNMMEKSADFCYEHQGVDIDGLPASLCSKRFHKKLN
jgi:hypothetical protein